MRRADPLINCGNSLLTDKVPFMFRPAPQRTTLSTANLTIVDKRIRNHRSQVGCAQRIAHDCLAMHVPSPYHLKPIKLYSFSVSADCRLLPTCFRTRADDADQWMADRPMPADIDELRTIHRSSPWNRLIKAPPAALTPRGRSRKNVLGHAGTGGRDPDRWPPGQAAGYRSDTTRSGLPRRWRKCPPLRPRT